MEANQLIEHLRNHPEVLESIASSVDGQALMQQLDSEKLEHATQQGQNGNYLEMAKLLKNVMNTPDGKAMLMRMAQQLQR